MTDRDPQHSETAADLESVIQGLMPDAQPVSPQDANPLLPGAGLFPAPEGEPKASDPVAAMRSELDELKRQAAHAEERRRESEASYYREQEQRRRAEESYRQQAQEAQARQEYFARLRAQQVPAPEFSDEDILNNPGKVRQSLAQWTQQVNAQHIATQQQLAAAFGTYQAEERSRLERESQRSIAEAKKRLEDEGFDDFDEVWEKHARPEFESVGDAGRRMMADPLQVRRAFLIHRDQLKGLTPAKQPRPKAPPTTPGTPSVRGRSGEPQARQLSSGERALLSRMGVGTKPLDAEELAILETARVYRGER